MSDYLVRLKAMVEVRVEGYESRDDAVERAREMLEEELDPTSFYIVGKAELSDVIEDTVAD